VLTERDNGMALAVLMLVGTLAAGGSAFIFAQRKRPQATRIAGGSALILLLGAGAAWALRPSLQSIDTRAQDMVDDQPGASASASPQPATRTTGKFICVLDPQRSRVTVSDITDVPIEWSADGCMNQRSQYGLANDGWSRVLVPNGEDTIAVTHFDPDSHTYTVERFLMGLDAMNAARAQRQKTIARPAAQAMPKRAALATHRPRSAPCFPPNPTSACATTASPRPDLCQPRAGHRVKYGALRALKIRKT
jgi:hypothetical protein